MNDDMPDTMWVWTSDYPEYVTDPEPPKHLNSTKYIRADKYVRLQRENEKLQDELRHNRLPRNGGN